MSTYLNVFHNADEIIDNLFTLDFICVKKEVRAELLILGGAGISLLMEINDHTSNNTHDTYAFRLTRDIDVNLLSSSDENIVLSILDRLNIHTVGGVIELPPMEDFELEGNYNNLNLGFSAIKVFLPAPELLACSKIFSKSGKDLEDLQESKLLDICNIEKLLALVDEYKGYMLNPDDIFMNVHELLHILELKGIY